MKKLMVIILLILAVLFFTVTGSIPLDAVPDEMARKVAVLKEIYKPMQIDVDSNHIYVSQLSTVYIYSLEDFQLKNKFGREGEGPREFKGYALLNVQPRVLLINSMGKLSFFKKNGTFIKEMRTGSENYIMKPLGENFVGFGFRVMTKKEDKINYKIINLYNSSLKKIKEIFKHELDWQQGKGTRILHLSFVYHTYGDKLYVAGKNDFVIDVFDKEGNPLFSISQDYQKKKFTKEDKDRILDEVKKTRSPENFERFKRNARFPEVFPAIHYFYIDNEKIYVKTHKTGNNRAEFFIFDIKGKLLKTTMIPLVDRLPKTNFPHVIKNNKLYQLVENQDTEMIELYVYEINQ
jgi:hypothetical protein